MRWLYNFIAHTSLISLRIAALFNPKLRAFLDVRTSWRSDLKQWSDSRDGRPVLCFHCASLGEYEMIVPILSDARIQSHYQCVVSFFSASGYDHAKLNGLAHKVYLPIDTRTNMKQFVSLLKPDVFVFVKYDLWYNLILQLTQTTARILLVNGLFRKGQFATSTLGRPIADGLKKFERVYVQNQESYDLGKDMGLENLELSSDLRFDRVLQIKAQALDIPEIEEFKEGKKTIIAGSSWPEEEALLAEFLKGTTEEIKTILAPHDIGEPHVSEIEHVFQNFDTRRYSEGSYSECNVLIINSIGLLSSIYRYADVAIIGGAFGKGLHNVLEAIAWGVPVITGPNTDKFPEAQMLEEAGVLFRINNGQELRETLDSILGSQELRNQISQKCGSWLWERSGSAKKVVTDLIG